MKEKMIFKDLYDGDYGPLFKKFDEVLQMIKTAHPDKYDDIKNDIYVLINGYHFNEEMLECALDHMINDDGTKAPKFTLEQTTQIANSNGVTFDHFNEYDWNYVMNMMYSDYSTIFADNLTYYLKLSTKFLMDKDAPEGKAFRYYLALKESTY